MKKSVSRRNFLAGCGAMALGSQFAMAQSGKKRRPNILVILTDDQGYADISLSKFSKPEVKTPRMDGLLQDGVRFTNAHTSGATCAPTRAGIMTGNYQQRHGLWNTPDSRVGLDIDAKLMPEYFKDSGYATSCIGKWHLGLTEEFNPVKRGFDYFYGFLGHGGHDYYELDPARPDEPGIGMYRNLEGIHDKGYLTTRIGDETIEWISKNQDKPWFSFVCFNAVHSPAQAPEKDIAKYDTGDELRNKLMAMLDHLDLNIGRIVDHLKKLKIYDNTLVFILTDNGGAGGMHADNTPLKGVKGTVWEGGHRTFFGMTWKNKIKSGLVNDAKVMSFDIMPTALAAAGIPIPSAVIDGKNLFPVVEGKDKNPHDYLVWANGTGPTAVYKDGWKFLRTKENRKKPVADYLHYLPDDISEKKNLAAEKPELVEEMVEIYKKWNAEMKPFNKKQMNRRQYDFLDPYTPIVKPKKNNKNKKKEEAIKLWLT